MSQSACSHSTILVDDPEITEVMDEITGEFRSAADVIGSDWERAVQQRMRSRDGIVRGCGRFFCAHCGVPVYLIVDKTRQKMHFRHHLEDGRCEAVTRGTLNARQIDTLRFHLQRESAAHIRLKAVIVESLEADPRFSDIKVEEVWKGAEKNEWRRPDVCATFDGRIPVAFEVQLSTTYLHVMAERRNFYLKNGGLLFWVFKNFAEDNAVMTQQDVFFNNNRNVFLAGERTSEASIQAKALMFEGHWHEPSISREQLVWTPKRQMVRFDELTIDLPTQRAFYFDADGSRAHAQEALQVQKDRPLREAFESCYVSYISDQLPFLEMEPLWAELKEQLSKRGLELPSQPREDDELRNLLNAAYSAKWGKAIGSDHHDLVKLGHHLVDTHKEALWLFELMLHAYGREQHMEEHDSKSKNWMGKAKRFREAVCNQDPLYEPDHRYDPILMFLFPEVAVDLPDYGCARPEDNDLMTNIEGDEGRDLGKHITAAIGAR
ncbi:MAG: DUF6035 family protein [Rhodanobacter sp.]